MKKIKIIQVKGKTPEERKQLIEDTQNLNPTIKGSSIYFEDKRNGLYGADIYFIQGETPIKELTQQTKPFGDDLKAGLQNERLKGDKPVGRDATQKPVTQNDSDGRGANQSSSSSSGGFNPTKEQLERWKTTRITKGTYGLLLSKGFTKEDIKNLKNQYNAYTALQNLKKENI